MAKRKPLTADKLMKYLIEVSQHNDLKTIQVNYRFDYDSDVENITCVTEDLYDAETNNILTDIVLVTDARDDKKEWYTKTPVQKKAEKEIDKAFKQLISLYDVCDELEDIGDDRGSKKMRATLNKLGTFIQSLKN